MTEKKRRNFPESFKLQAVDRVVAGSQPLVRIAEELGIHETVLRRWVRKYGQRGTGAAWRSVTQAQAPSPADLAAENAKLKRELQRAQTERDILKNRSGPLPACAR